ncbi:MULTISPECIES: glycosyltransferase [Halostella]|uniref:glycosyltransferase n=1 Tax=Halostella TaxID=1843185 RepID=UPI00196332D4|nr:MULTISPECIES: glycosyltransferase [Halostella]
MHQPVTTGTTEQPRAEYAKLVEREQWEQLQTLATELGELRVLHVNSTASGGGVAEMLHSLVPLSNSLDVDTDWVVMDADDRFFEVTKALHNGLQGQEVTLTDEMRATYRAVTDRNAGMVTGEYDIVVLHDPQTLGMIPRLTDRFPNTRFIWRCHIDLTAASQSPLSFIVDYAREVDQTVFSHSNYRPGIDVPSTIIYPSIDPLSEKNRPQDQAERAATRNRLDSIPFDTGAPVVTQVSRFDPWKDPLGVVQAFQEAQAMVPDAHLVLAGGMADDDPEGPEVYDRVADATADDPRIHLLTNEPDTTINFLQRESDVVVQKSLREGFGLVVAEALWKQTPVIGSNVGGIPVQIDDGANGYLVDPDDTSAVSDRLERLLADEEHRNRLGQRGRETVRERFLLTRHLVDYFELYDGIL